MNKCIWVSLLLIAINLPFLPNPISIVSLVLALILLGVGLFTYLEGDVTPDPRVNEVWTFTSTPRNPFEEPNSVDAFIVDVKEGWVKYHWGEYTKEFHQVMKVKDFKETYVKKSI